MCFSSGTVLHIMYLALNMLAHQKNRLAVSRGSMSSARSDTNWAVQPLKMARGLKFRIKKGEGLYYL